MKIRFGSMADAQMLAALGKTTFVDAYRSESKLERKYIDDYVESAFDSAVIAREIEDRNTVFLIAEINAIEIGFAKLKIGSRRNVVKTRSPIEISRIYLKKEYWGRSLGRVLLGRCFDEAESHDCDSIWLSVWEHNARAIRFYENFGFKKIGTHIFDLASSPQTDFLMLKELTKKYERQN